PTQRIYLLVAALFALSLMAKPMLTPLPVMLLLLDIWPLRRRVSFALIREKLPLLAIAIADAVVTVIAQHRVQSVRSLTDYSLALRLQTTAITYGRSLLQHVWFAGL